MAGPGIPLAWAADEVLAALSNATGSAAVAALDGETLLGERATKMGFAIPGRISAGGACRLIDALDGVVALNLARPSDRELLPALFEDDGLDPEDNAEIARLVARCEARGLISRGRMLGLALAAFDEPAPLSRRQRFGVGPSPHHALASLRQIHHKPSPFREGCLSDRGRKPRVVDLSALWAGPLAAHLLWLAGAEVIKVESRTRHDAMRDGQPTFYALLNQGKASVALDLRDGADYETLLALIAEADIVIEAARPRALAQLGIDADAIVAATPGLVWLSITAHGAEGDASDWIGFGDDVGVAAGLSHALFVETGRIGFVGDAIADPLTGIHAALVGWEAWQARRGGRYGLAMRNIVADYLRESDPALLRESLVAWAGNEGRPFPPARVRPTGPLPAFGSSPTRWSPC